MEYKDYKHLTVDKYRIHYNRPDPHIQRMFYVYEIIAIEHSEEGIQVYVVQSFLHHDLMVARKAAIEQYESEKEKLLGKYSVDSDKEYDPAFGKSYNISLLLESISNHSEQITVKSTIDPSQPDEEQKVFKKLKERDPERDFLHNVMTEEELTKMKTEIEIPYKRGVHEVRLPFYRVIRINVV